MPDRSPPEPGRRGPTHLWTQGELRLRLRPPGGGSGLVAHVPQPFALIGRGAGADLRVDDPAASTRHVYLHLDRRGLFAVDLATRTGTRFGDVPRATGWLGPGDDLEIAGHRFEVIEAGPTRPDPGPPDPLEDAADAPLAGLTLFPHQPPWESRAVGSELLFLGRGAHCGIRVQGEQVARVHCVLVRGTRAAYAVDLSGGRTRLNDRALSGASPLLDGDVLALGAARFEVRVRTSPATDLAAGLDPARPFRSVAGVELAEALPVPLPWPWAPPGTGTLASQAPLAPEVQGALLAWIVQTVQTGQGEALRRQGEFQRDLAGMVRQICLDNATVLHEHLRRMDHINEEIAALRDEIRRRLGPTSAPAPPSPPPLRIAAVEPPSDPEQSTSWLLDRVQRLEEENRSTWRDLLGRLGGQPRRAP